MRHILNETGVKAHLRGKKSGHVEIGQREDQLEPLHILLQGDRTANLEEAKKLAEDLLATVKSDLDALMAPPPLPFHPQQPMAALQYSQPPMYPMGYATGHPSYYPPLNNMYPNMYAPYGASPMPHPPMASVSLPLPSHPSPSSQPTEGTVTEPTPKSYNSMPPPPGLYK